MITAIRYWRFRNAIRVGRTDQVRAALRRGLAPNGRASDDLAPLALAVSCERADIVALLLEAGADPDRQDRESRNTPLMHAVKTDGDDPVLVRMLLAAGANPDLVDARGQSALHHAVLAGKLEALRVLLAHGAGPNLRDADGVTCLNLTNSMHGLGAFKELLLAAGADPTIVDNLGKTYQM